MFKLIQIALVAYLIGTFTFAYLIGKFRKVDLRHEGSGNLGAYNTGLVLGKRLGLLVLFLDACKGALAVWLGWHLSYSLAGPLLAAIFVVVGHNFPFWLGFKGGKGLAAAAGAALLLSPIFLLAEVAVAVLALILTRDVDVAGITLIIAMVPVAAIINPLIWPSKWFIGYSLVTAIIIGTKHHKEFRKLFAK